MKSIINSFSLCNQDGLFETGIIKKALKTVKYLQGF